MREEISLSNTREFVYVHSRSLGPSFLVIPLIVSHRAILGDLSLQLSPKVVSFE